ncbi:hypothetical protein EJ03DRAFT_275480 [Teratosphaeria nubilosa]|uniref:Methyltransferase domain-containing protein n=1 Tax=Teratosphaeria nubilosa TaxID=161662 RepID=A0A6G1L4H4_9PEZI|nr:hypothetical protein EJ03DRAFT_275480 [Teratosphaeria nubilosa]
MDALSKLGRKPVYFADCCAGISWPLLETLVERLPEKPGLILSIGCGSGLLESLLLHVAKGELNLYGVEVPLCVNRHLPEERMLRVPCSESLHPDALLASCLVFVYPRQASLVGRYVETFLDGALDQLVWLGHRSDWPDFQNAIMPHFHELETVDDRGVANNELLVIASVPRR